MGMVKLGRPAAKSKAGLHYFMVPTLKDGRRLITGAPQEVADERAARNRIELMPPNMIGLAACEVEMDAEGEQVAEPALLARQGKIPGGGLKRETEDA